ncbi:dihydrofolate reductase family protein [Microlunatus speluncae]|uniref:dihydrofolate reductase family protein n=1 Tax=Microlunatus speluncae TaxID=2594267 RepID=UPI00126621E7|nr:dihydrofolate reductase family protein [Microlunatus speluncae]
MGIVFSSFTVSLDGFVAYPDDSVGELFEWYANGEVEVRPAGYPITFRMSEASARYWRRNETEGVFVCGRGIFDHANGWGGKPPNDSPTFVITHRPPPADWPPIPGAPFTFVDSVQRAIEQARAVAGDRDINVAGPSIAQQCINLGILDEVRLDLAPIFLRDGIRYFDNLDNENTRLELLEVVEGKRITHLRYRVTYA